MNYSQTYQLYLELVEKELEKCLPVVESYPGLLHQAMHYSVMGGGKRIRPVLVLAAAETVGGHGLEIAPAACALELIHTYSLIHDDLPAMDDDDFRRGRPSNHKVYGEAMAILAGDALLSQAFFLLANLNVSKPHSRLRVISEIACASGSLGMVGGQVADTCPDGEMTPDAALDYIHRHKTGALLRVCVRTGAILAGAAEGAVERLSEYGDNLGLLFQIVDDILDVEGDADKLGKPTGSDEKKGRLTYPLLYGLAESKQKAAQTAERAVASLSLFGAEADFLRQLIQQMTVRDH